MLMQVTQGYETDSNLNISVVERRNPDVSDNVHSVCSFLRLNEWKSFDLPQFELLMNWACCEIP